jgi:cytochrome c peroxidase
VIGVGVALVVLSMYRARLDTLAVALGAFDRIAATVGAADTATVRAGFRRVRLAYKRVECVVEYVDPADAAALNGPATEGIGDAAGWDPGEPDEESSGGLLQSVERAIYRIPVLFPSTRQQLTAEIGGARMAVDRLRASADTVRLADADIAAAARLEVVRVAALGLAGDDSRAAHDGIPEARAALAGTRDMLHATRAARVDSLLRAGEAMLSGDDVNRLRFIVAIANPLTAALAPMARGAYDAWTDMGRRGPPASAAEVALGARLFRDPALSGPRTRSCATCHQPARGFTDGLARAAPLPGRTGVLLRHTPTLINAALADVFFDDGRAASLEAQVYAVVANPNEMAGSMPLAARRLGGRGPRQIARALAAYERTLLAFDSRADRAFQGDTLALSGAERRGFELFMGKGACGTCHYFPLLNGMRPPTYRQADFEVLGAPGDADSGRAVVTHDPADVGAMKTPGLRFAVPGGPYMHNVTFRTLDDVVDFYDRGGVRTANQTLAPAPLHLSDDEKRDLIAFLQALRI